MAKEPGLTTQEADFPQWYQEVITKAELAENGPVRGTMVIRPYAFGIWELLQSEMDRRIKEADADNAYFPVFIPESFLQKEAEHVEGFAPELAVVTHGGGKKLEEPVVVRPTSETIINYYFAKWIQSHRDLPLLINQWCNVVRWELRPRLFLRTSEFLWQEGHTAHATKQDAHEYALGILHTVYNDTMLNVLGVPVQLGRKTDDERFAGATETWACEGMMRDGKALQMATSHELGQNFAHAFDTQFLAEDGSRQFVWQTSWGSSTRMLGGLIMTHGDNYGLRVPPAVAPIQVVLLPLRDDDGSGVRELVQKLGADLKARGLRIEIDDRLDQSFGRRSVGWELRGVPVRIEVGPRDLAVGNVTVVRRDTREKAPLPVDQTVDHVVALLGEIQQNLLTQAKQHREANTHPASSVAEAREIAATGFAVLPWHLVDESNRNELTTGGITVRCLQRTDGSLPQEGDAPEELHGLVARAY